MPASDPSAHGQPEKERRRMASPPRGASTLATSGGVVVVVEAQLAGGHTEGRESRGGEEKEGWGRRESATFKM